MIVRPTIREAAILMLFAAIPALLTAWLHPRHPAWSWQRPEVAEVTPETVLRWDSPLWIDARESPAYAQAHVPGAVSLNETEWESSLPSLLAVWQPGRRVVIYCSSQSCDASRAVALRLQRELGMHDVFVLKGGWSAWMQMGQ
jgi:rhodanese-related sulfurtransferase